jgi:transposase-like protein
MLVRIDEIVDDRLCYEKVRELRWAEGVKCPHCGSSSYRRHGHHNTTEHRLRYQCKDCERYYDDLSGTVFEGHHQPLKVWILCLYLMSLNLSNAQIARELGLSESDLHQMSSRLREGVYEKRPVVVLSGAVEADELYVVAGHKGQPQQVKKKGANRADGG